LVLRLFERIDADSSGQISAEEFAEFIAWKPSARSAEREIQADMSYAEKLQVSHSHLILIILT